MTTKFPILPVLQHYGLEEDLPETERWRSCKCPFHGDRSPSATYVAGEDAQAFKCFACPVQGDAIAIVRRQEQLDYKEALTFLESITGTTVQAGNHPAHVRYQPVRIGEATPSTSAPAQRRRKKLRLRED